MSRGLDSPSGGDIEAFFEQRNPDGTHVYSDSDVRVFLPLLILLYQIDYQSSSATKAVMKEFLSNARFKTVRTPQDVMRVIRDYVESNPAVARIARDFAVYCARLERAMTPSEE